MTSDAPGRTKQIPQERWQAFCATFRNGNRGRMLSMEIIGDDVGDQWHRSQRWIESFPIEVTSSDPKLALTQVHLDLVRDRTDLGSTFLGILDRYAEELQAHESKLILPGKGETDYKSS